MNNSVIDVIQINLNQFSGDPEILPGAGEDALNTVSLKIVKVIKKALIVLHLTWKVISRLFISQTKK